MRSTPDNTSRFLIILTNIWNDVIDCNPYGFLAYIAFIHIRTAASLFIYLPRLYFL